MSAERTNRALFVVLYPYKFTDFVYELMELSYFRRYSEVLVLDVSPLTSAKFSRGISAGRSARSEVVVVSSWREFVRRVRDLRRRAADTNLCIQNVVPHSSAAGFLCNLLLTLLLKRTGVALFDLYISGTPVYQPGTAAEPEKRSHLARSINTLLRFARHTTTLSEAAKKVSSALLAALARWVPSAITHRLVAGDDWEALARMSGPARKRVRLVYGHSHDFSNNLLRERQSYPAAPASRKSAVLLDAAGPMFGDDYIYMGRKVYLTSEAWYPALTRFFDRLEAETGVRLEVAGHYKSTHPPIAPCFGNRAVHYGKTRELVRQCEFVLTRQSAAVAYAVMFRKPALFIYSSQIKQDLRAMRGIGRLAAMLGTEPVNIDEPPPDIRPYLKVDEERYLRFERACLTSGRSRRPNSQIVLEDIMNIPAAPEFRELPGSGTAVDRRERVPMEIRKAQ